MLLFIISLFQVIAKKQVWLDIGTKKICKLDTGDTQALSILYGALNFQIIGISTIYGKQSAYQAGVNALKITTNLEMPYHIPVIQGLDVPMNNHTCVSSQGQGMYKAEVFPDHQIPIFSQDLTQELNVQVEYRAKNNSFILVLFGPATNFAKLLMKYPERIENIQEVIIVGGDFDGCDHNFNCDPDAYKILIEILQSNYKTITFIPKMNTVTPRKYLDLIQEINQKFSNWILEFMQLESFSIHKILGLYYIVNRDQFETQSYGIEIIDKEDCKGYTQFYETDNNSYKIKVVVNVKMDKLYNQLIQVINKGSKAALMN